MINLYELIQNPAALAALVAAVTAWVKARVNLKGNMVVIASFVISGGIVALGLLSQAYPEFINTIIVVIIGAVGAGGTVDALKNVLGGK